MKKIAADKNYRILREAMGKNESTTLPLLAAGDIKYPEGAMVENDDKYGTYTDEARRRLSQMASETGANANIVGNVHYAVSNLALIPSKCRGDSVLVAPLSRPGCESSLKLAVDLTEDALSGMKNSDVWAKYKEVLFADIKKHADKDEAREAIGFIVMKNMGL